MENKSTKNDKINIYFKMIYSARKIIPRSDYFILFIVLLKLIGLIIISHLFRRGNSDPKNLIVATLMRNLCFYKELKSLNDILFFDYNKICLIILIVIMTPYILFYLLFKIIKFHDDTVEFTKIQKYILKIIGLLFTINFVLIQHMLEILYFIFLHIYISRINSDDNSSSVPLIIKENFKKFEETLIINKYFYCIVNIILILLTNWSSILYFRFLNEPFHNSHSGFRFTNDKLFLMCMIILPNLQGIQYYDWVFSDKTQQNFLVFVLILALIISFTLSAGLAFSYNFNSLVIYLIHYFSIECGLSCILDIVIYILNSKPYSASQLYMFLSSKIAFPVAIIILINSFKAKFYIKKIEENIFNKNKRGYKLDVLYSIVDLIDDAMNDCNKFIIIFNLIYKHQLKCRKNEETGNLKDKSDDSKCSCSYFNSSKFPYYFFKASEQSKLMGDQKKKNNMIIFEELLLLFENELKNMIYKLSNTHHSAYQFYLVVLYLDFIFIFRGNINFANYLIEQYLLSFKDIPTIFRFYFYSYKRKLFKKSKSNFKNKKSKLQLYYFEFLNYIKIIENLRLNMHKSCVQLNDLIIEKNIHIETLKNIQNIEDGTNNSKLNIVMKSIFIKCRDFNSCYDEIILLIKKNYYNKLLKNQEICFLLSEFFKIIDREIPFEISSKFLKINSYEEINQVSSCFAEVKMDQPIIISLSKIEEFPIKYISQKLCDFLNYKREELIGKDFNILLPQDKFVQEHKILVQKTLFIKKKNYFLKDTFVLAKDDYCVAIKINMVFMPSITEKFLIIINLTPILQDEKSQYFYDFVLDFQTNFISFSKNFHYKFGLSKEIFTKLNVTFSTLFNINVYKHKDKISKCLNSINDIDMDTLDSMVKLFRPVSLIKTMDCIKKSKSIGVFTCLKDNERVIEFTKKKEKMLPCIVKMRKAIEEGELDRGWIEIIDNMEKELFKFYPNSDPRIYRIERLIQMKKSSSYSINSIEKYKNLKKKNPYSRGIYFPSFTIKLAICNIGNLPYFYARVYDSDEITSNSNINDIRYFGSPTRDIILLSKRTNNKLKNDFNQKNFFNIEKDLVTNLVLKKQLKQLTPKNNFLLNDQKIFEESLNPENKDTNVEPSLEIQSYYSVNNINLTNTKVNAINASISTLMRQKTKNGKQINDPSWIKKQEHLNNFRLDSIKRETRQKYFFFFMFASLISLITITICNFKTKNNIFEIAKILHNINYYSHLTKAYIYFSSGLVTLGCNKSVEEINNGVINLDNKDLSLMLKDYSLQLKDIFKRLCDEIINSNGKVNEVTKILSGIDQFQLLFSDWSTFNRENSSLYDELIHFEYYISKLQSPEYIQKCHLKNFFSSSKTFDTSIKTVNGLINNTNQSNYLDSVMYYIIKNVIEIYFKKFEKINIQTNSYSKNYLENNKFCGLFLNLSVLFFAFLLIFWFYCIFYNYNQRIRNTIMKFYLSDRKDLILSKKLENLLKILKKFNYKDRVKYQIKKEEIEKNIYSQTIDNMTNSLKEINKLVEEKDLYITRKNSNSHRDYISNPRQNFNDPVNEIQNNSSINISTLLNKTQNETLAMILPENSILKKLKSKNITQFKHDSVRQISNLNNMNSDDECILENFNLKFALEKCSYLFLIISLIIYFLLLLTHSIIDIKSYERLIIANFMTSNYIERISKFSALTLYQKISIIKDNPYLIYHNKSDFEFDETSKLFEQEVLNDSLFKILGNSEFSHFYYEIESSKSNIDSFMNEEKYYDILPQVRQLEKLIQMSKTEDICNNFVASAEKWINNLEINSEEKVNYKIKISQQCNIFTKQMSKIGFNNILNIFETTLRNLYIDYANEKFKSGSDDNANSNKVFQEQRILKHFSQEKLNQIFAGVQIVFEKFLRTFTFIINEDMKAMHDNIDRNESIYSLSILGFNLIFIMLTTFAFMNKYESYYIHTSNAIKKYTRAIKLEN